VRHPREHQSAGGNPSPLTKMAPFERTCDIWRWKQTRFDAPHPIHATYFLVARHSFHFALHETPKIEQNHAACGKGSCIPRQASISSRGERLGNSFDRAGCSVRPNIRPCRTSSDSDMLVSTTSLLVNDMSLYKHFSLELPEPDPAQQLILPCTASSVVRNTRMEGPT
jgi:hypothetical protein